MNIFTLNVVFVALGSFHFMEVVKTEKIIFFHQLISYSHRVQTWPLAEALVEKGHDVTYISPFYPKEPNPSIKEIVPKDFVELLAKHQASDCNVNLRISGEMPSLLDITFDTGVNTCQAILGSKEIKKWVEENPKADLVIIDNCFADCGVALAYKLGAKHIYFNTVSLFGHEYDSMGLLPQASAIPELETYTLTPPFSFFDRITNSLLSLRWRWEHYQHTKRLDEIARKELNIPDMPGIDDLIRNASLVFYTGDYISDYPRALPPLYVNIAGIHTKPSTKSLPKEIEDFISSKTISGEPNDGFIYISLGSMITSSNLPGHIKDIFFDVIKSFPQIKFLWKWDGVFPEETPPNLYLSKWFPQVDILGHPKVKGFVTQCGRPSLMEALYNGVPLIAFPVLGDQEMNADRLKEMGAAVRLDIASISYNDLRDSVQKVVYDSSMKKRVSKLRKIFLDRPMSPLDTALWWTDYVLKNEDTSHLRPVGNDQFWFVRRQLDVWATLSISAFVVFIGFIGLALKVIKLYVNAAKIKDE